MTDPCDPPPENLPNAAEPDQDDRIQGRQDGSLAADPRVENGGNGKAMPAIELCDEQLHRIAKAMADPQRFAILGCIAAAVEIPCKTLVAEFPITQATISHHLKELVAAELIHSRRDGQMAILSCRRDVCEAYTEVLSQRLVTPGTGRHRSVRPT